MNTRALVLSLLFLVVVGGGVYLFGMRESSSTATNFEECVQEGNPVMESYPRQCNTKDGRHFTEVLGVVSEKDDLIRVTSPLPGDTISNPLTITGEARGSWFFEASFPVFLTDWDGKIIGQGIAQAKGDWMTTDYVPFTATLTFATPAENYSDKGTLILKKDNPSGLPEYDNALEMQVHITATAPQLTADAYPLYAGATWGTEQSKIDMGITGYKISATPVENISNIAGVTQPFEKYYADKLKAAGWAEEPSLAADGPGASITAYRKGNEFIVISFSTDFKGGGKDEPVQCPCNTTLSVFSGVAN